MSNNKSQVEVIKEKLVKDGKVSNLCAFRNYILRLGAVIFVLRDEGWVIETEYKNKRRHRNCVYKLIYKPE